MKIALLVPNFSEYSGDARVVNNQAEKMIENGHQVTIFAFNGDIRPKSTKVVYLGMPKTLFWQRVYRLLFPLDVIKIHRIIPEFRFFDLVIAHLYPMSYLGHRIKRKYGITYQFWFHGLEDPELFEKFHERMYMRLFLFLTRYSLRNVDTVISVSKFAQKTLLNMMGVESQVQYNQVDEALFHKDIDGTSIRRQLGLNNSPVILSVGRLVPQKKFDILLKVFSLIHKTLPESRLVIIGKPTFLQYYEELRRLSNESVIFIDFVPNDEMPQYYAMCDVYATCSYWENHNLPILEAQMCGKPVVAFDIEAFREEVDSNGVLVTKGDLVGFADACLRKIMEQRQKSV